MEYCYKTELYKWLGSLDIKQDILNDILFSLVVSHNYPKISQEQRLEMCKYFVELGADVKNNYYAFFMRCFCSGDFLVLEYLTILNPNYDYSQLFESKAFIETFESTYNTGLLNLEKYNTFLTNELQLFNNIYKCKFVIKLGYKPSYEHDLFDYYKSIHLT